MENQRNQKNLKRFKPWQTKQWLDDKHFKFLVDDVNSENCKNGEPIWRQIKLTTCTRKLKHSGMSLV